MNRENKRKTFEPGYYKTHACKEAFTCRCCGRLVTPDGAASAHRNHCPNCLTSLHVRRADGTGGGVGAQGGRVGHCPPVPPVRCVQLQPGGGGRQPHEADVHRHEAAGLAPFPIERMEELTRLMGGEGSLG